MKEIRGTGVALVTPFKSDLTVDFEALRKHVNFCIDGGVDYLVVLGTTGESATLSADEKQEVAKAVAEYAGGRVPLVIGIGGNNTSDLVRQLESTDLTPFTAVLSVSPYYNKPNQEGIFRHYKALAGASAKPIILYNVPGRTGSNITAETTLRLAHEEKKIVAIKEASGDLEQIMTIVRDKPSDFMVISGDDNMTLPMIACGAEGVISVTGQACPRIFTDMVRNSLAGNFEKARKLHYLLFGITNMLFAEGSPGGVKAALKARGICGDDLRPPLSNISDELNKKIKEELEKL